MRVCGAGLDGGLYWVCLEVALGNTADLQKKLSSYIMPSKLESGSPATESAQTAPVAELADAQDLGSCGRPCRFKSCRGQN